MNLILFIMIVISKKTIQPKKDTLVRTKGKITLTITKMKVTNHINLTQEL